MKPIQSLFPFAFLACLSLVAETPIHRPLPEPLPVPTQDPAPTPQNPEPAPQGPAQARAGACASTGCPRLDQHGHGPVSCEFKSGLATGFRCILFCTYPDAQWGTLVDSSRCD